MLEGKKKTSKVQVDCVFFFLMELWFTKTRIFCGTGMTCGSYQWLALGCICSPYIPYIPFFWGLVYPSKTMQNITQGPNFMISTEKSEKIHQRIQE